VSLRLILSDIKAWFHRQCLD